MQWQWDYVRNVMELDIILRKENHAIAENIDYYILYIKQNTNKKWDNNHQ